MQGDYYYPHYGHHSPITCVKTKTLSHISRSVKFISVNSHLLLKNAQLIWKLAMSWKAMATKTVKSFLL